MSDMFQFGMAIGTTTAPPPAYDPAALLSLVTASPYFLWGTTRLVSAYAGPAFRVIRASDNDELDIGFDDNRLDEDLLASFWSGETANTVEILKFYDMTGNSRHSDDQTTSAYRLKLRPTNPRHNGNLTLAGEGTNGGRYTLSSVSFNANSYTLYNVGEYAGYTLGLFQLDSSGVDPYWEFVNHFDGNITSSPKLPFTLRPAVYEMHSSTTSRIRSVNGDSQSLAAASSATISSMQFNVGNTSYGMDGFVSALVGYAPNLDTTDRAAFKDAMEYAYGLNTAAITKRIVFIGDSISVGLDAQNAAGTANDYGWTRRIHKHLNSDTIALHYDAASGRRLVDYLSTYSSSIAHQIITDDPTALAVILLGINDINNAARTDAQVYADMESLVALVQADGGEAIVCSLLPASTLTSGEQAYRTAYVASLQADHAFADGFIDFDAEPTMGPDAAASNTTYYTDGVHPTSAGHEILAEFAADAINTYLGI